MKYKFKGVAIPRMFSKLTRTLGNTQSDKQHQMEQNRSMLKAYTEMMDELALRGQEFAQQSDKTQNIILEAIAVIAKHLPKKN